MRHSVIDEQLCISGAVSLWFLPRDVAMLARSWESYSVRLSHACFVTNPKNLPAIFLYHVKGQSF